MRLPPFFYTFWRELRSYVVITVGAMILSLGMVLFLIPSQIAAGGVSGLSIIVNYYTGFPVGTLVLLFNIPLLILGLIFLGGMTFGIRTFYATLVYSVAIDVLTPLLPAQLTGDVVLATLFGGLFSGVGVGLVLRERGTTGGTDIVARLIQRYWGIPLGYAVMLADFSIITAAGFSFGWEKALYALVALYVSGRAVSVTQEGVIYYRTAFIISEKSSDVAKTILTDMQRGVTSLSAHGMYTGINREVLVCAVTQAEVARLKEIVKQKDPDAFLLIIDTHEVIGQGFRSI
jgi:uncharacterized membrane-anchored protein YitT (DUF2179 family)